MSTLYVSEFSKMAPAVNNVEQPQPLDPPTVSYTVTYTGTPGQSQPFRPDTKLVTFSSDGVFAFLVGSNPTAAISDRRVAAGTERLVSVTPGQRVSAITTT